MTDATCADRVSERWNSRRSDLAVLFNVECGEDERRSCLDDIGADHSDMDDDDLAEAISDAQGEYGLGFDYVAPDTFGDQSEPYYRYQLSCGGPSDELRLYVADGSLYKAEYWFLDWFDGAHLCLTRDDTVQAIHEFMADVGAYDAAHEASFD